jgi:hypothetical protein
MQYYILMHTNGRSFEYDGGITEFFCRVVCPDEEANIMNETFDDFVTTGCYGSYKALKMTEEQFNKGTITPVVPLHELPRHIMDVVGYYPY